jgi:hypothetical protein
MTPSDRYSGPKYAPLRFVVWVLAFVLLGRAYYDNTLYDLRQLTATHVFLRLAAIGTVVMFAYWNLFVANTRVVIYIWTTVSLFLSGRIMLLRVVEAQAESAEARDPLDRRKHSDAVEDDSFSEIIDRFATDDRIRD